MSDVVVAYIPALHEGYRRFLVAHAQDRRLFLIGPDLYADYRPLAKDIRCLDASLVALAVESWRICSAVTVLHIEAATRLAAEGPSMTLPDEDVSHQIVERFFDRLPVLYDPVFLRWDKSRSVRLERPPAIREVGHDDVLAEMRSAAEDQAQRSIDWWRQVGAAIRFSDGTMASATNDHVPHRSSPYVVGDPRSNFRQGVHVEISTAVHAEAKLIADAARRGISTDGASLYVTDFPCPPCAKLIAGAGVSTLYFETGYAVLDGYDVLADAAVDIARVVR